MEFPRKAEGAGLKYRGDFSISQRLGSMHEARTCRAAVAWSTTSNRASTPYPSSPATPHNISGRLATLILQETTAANEAAKRFGAQGSSVVQEMDASASDTEISSHGLCGLLKDSSTRS